MNLAHPRPPRTNSLAIAAAAALAAMTGLPAHAQFGFNESRGPAFAPRPRTSAPAMGGVRAGFPQTNKPVMRSQPPSAHRPMPVGPFPGTPIPHPRYRQGYRPVVDPRFDGRSDNFVNGDPGRRIPGGGRHGNRYPGHVGYGYDHGIFNSGSGLTVNGYYSDDNWKLGFHVGSDPSHLIPHHGLCPQIPTIGWGGYYGLGLGSYYGYWDSYPSYPVIEGVYIQPAPEPEPQQPAPSTQPVTPSNDRELGDSYLAAGDAKAAAAAYRSFLASNPSDALAMRSLGLALLDLAQTKEAVAMFALAYRTAPNLAISVIPIDAYRGGAAELRDNLRRASVYANQARTASAWLTVAVLMQAEGRTANARTMLDRARAAGLDPVIVTRLQSALTP